MTRAEFDAAMADADLTHEAVAAVVALAERRAGADLTAVTGLLSLALAQVILDRIPDAERAAAYAAQCPLVEMVRVIGAIRAEGQA
jgi:hypothetical protein